MNSATNSLAKLRQGLHISYSQVRTYLLCPAKYEHNYILGTEPSHRPINLVLGSGVHHALAAYYSHVQGSGQRMAQDKLLAVFRDRWEEEMNRPIPTLFDEKKDEGAILDIGIALLRIFHEKSEVPSVEAVEIPFSVDLVDPATGEVIDMKLVGAFDLVTNGASRPMIWEHKTAARKYSPEQLAYDLQPSLYSYAAKELGMDNPDLRYQLLIKTKTPAIQVYNVERTDAHITEALETTCTVLKAVEAGIFFKQRGWACADCQFKYKCDEGGAS